MAEGGESGNFRKNKLETGSSSSSKTKSKKKQFRPNSNHSSYADRVPYQNEYQQDDGFDYYSNYGRPPWYPDEEEVVGKSTLNPNAQPFVPYNNNFKHQKYTPSEYVSQRRAEVVERLRKKYAVSNENKETFRGTERLVEELELETYECMICCHAILRQHHVWSCNKCNHIFHFHRKQDLSCISKWAKQSHDENGCWRCPGCQNVNDSIPSEYLCFCGKSKNPRSRSGHDVPHTCGQVCGKARGQNCPHKCTLPCHPGPCPVCPRLIPKKCNCQAEQRTVRCGASDDWQCTKVCGKLLNCGIHKCEGVCHKDECLPCDRTVSQVCYCGRSNRELLCTVEHAKLKEYGCGERCPNLYDCAKHQCEHTCHTGICGLCSISPERLTCCPCGKTHLTKLLDKPREDCSDPVPVCGEICDKKLKCGMIGRNHHCQSICHTCPCPICPESTPIRCRCGATTKQVPCSQLDTYNDENPLLCERRCKKQRTCKQHKCNQVCCVDREHLCLQICGKKLSCGLHTCDRLCHTGRCSTCLRATFEELHCLCGASVVEPPVPCGSELPICTQLCTREHQCDHDVTHRCHSEQQCPPCTFLTKKLCYGKHELRPNIPCHLEDVSCGKPCGQLLSCGDHKCIKTCHPGVCLKGNEQCRQPCPIQRELCDHTCAFPCHVGQPCPQTQCRAAILVTCKCGRKTERVTCTEVDRLWTRHMAAQVVADKCTDVGGLDRMESVEKYKCLLCDDTCARIIRNRVLAEALNLDGVDLSGQNEPSYTTFLKSFCKSNQSFVMSIEKSLIELVEMVDKSKTGNVRSFAFPPMIRDQRRAVHEYAQYFLIDTNSYDPEPQRNVVSTAKKGRSYIPSILLSSFIPRDAKLTRVAPPPNSSNPWNNQMQTSPSSSEEMQNLGPTTMAVLRRSPPLIRSTHPE